MTTTTAAATSILMTLVLSNFANRHCNARPTSSSSASLSVVVETVPLFDDDRPRSKPPQLLQRHRTSGGVGRTSTNINNNDVEELRSSLLGTSRVHRQRSLRNSMQLGDGGAARRRNIDYPMMRWKAPNGRRRSRREPAPSVPVRVPEVVEVPADMKHIVDDYFVWRHSNGYGRSARRWGK